VFELPHKKSTRKRGIIFSNNKEGKREGEGAGYEKFGEGFYTSPPWLYQTLYFFPVQFFRGAVHKICIRLLQNGVYSNKIHPNSVKFYKCPMSFSFTRFYFNSL